MVCRMESQVVSSPGGDPDTLDLAGQGLEKLSRATPELILNTTTLLLDNNNLTRLDNIYTYQCLEKLSASGNQLIRMFQVSKLHHLKVLDLSSNNIVTIEGLKDVKLLTWLSLAKNNIASIENLNQNVHLEHVDLSNNNITTITDISNLKNLKTLMLHQNRIDTLNECTRYLPGSVTTLTLSDNQLVDLAHLSHLVHLTRIDQLTIANNPCLQQPQDIKNQFDYRPYVINWCLSLRLLDGVMVCAKESLKAEWMYSQSKGRNFVPGQHDALLTYLTQTCPLDPNQETDQDRKLNLILCKVQEHQSSLRQSRPITDGFATLPRTHHSESKKTTPGTPRRNSGAGVDRGSTPSNGHASTPVSSLSTPINTPSLARRHSTGPKGIIRTPRGSAKGSTSPGRRGTPATPSQYRMELPASLYGEDLVNGNSELMTQSMDPAVLAAKLTDNCHNNDTEDLMSVSAGPAIMSQSADASMFRENLNERVSSGSQWPGHSPTPVRPRSLFSGRSHGHHDSGTSGHSDMEVTDISDSESGSILPSFGRSLQSRLNPVPESLNSPDITTGPSPPRRDDPLHSGQNYHNLPPGVETRLSAARSGNNGSNGAVKQHAEVKEEEESAGTKASLALDIGAITENNNDKVMESDASGGSEPAKDRGDRLLGQSGSTSGGTSPRPSDAMVAAVTARTSAPKQSPNVVTRPTSAVKPSGITSKVDSGLSARGAQAKTPQARSPRTQETKAETRTPPDKKSGGQGGQGGQVQRSHSAGPTRKSSLPNKQVAALKGATPDTTRKRVVPLPVSLADDEASDTESEMVPRKPQEKAPLTRAAQDKKRASQESGSGRRKPSPYDPPSNRGRNNNNPGDHMSKSASSVHVGGRLSVEQNRHSARSRSTSLTRSQSARLGKGGEGRAAGGSFAEGRQSNAGVTRPRSSTLSSSGSSRGAREQQSSTSAALSIQSGWRGHTTRTRDPQVQQVKEELRTLRAEQHIKQLSKELRMARAALEQERKLRTIQSDTIKVLWKEIQDLQQPDDDQRYQEERHFSDSLLLTRQYTEMSRQLNDMSRGFSDSHRSNLSRNLRITERKLARLVGGPQMQDDSDSSRGEDFGGLGSGGSSADTDPSVQDLSKTCVRLQSQVEQLQNNLAGVVRLMSERSRHSSSSQDTPPCLRPSHTMTASLDLGSAMPSLPNSMTMSLPPSISLPPPVTMSRSCDSLSQTDIVAVRTPQTEGYPFLTPRLTNTDLDTSDSDHTRQDGAASPVNKMTTPPSRARSPRPQSLPGVGDCMGAVAKRGPPPGSSIPGMDVPSPPGPVVVRSFARNLVEGLLCETGREMSSRAGVDTMDDVTDISMSFDQSDTKLVLTASSSPRAASQSSHTLESDSLEENSPKKDQENGATHALAVGAQEEN